MVPTTDDVAATHTPARCASAVRRRRLAACSLLALAACGPQLAFTERAAPQATGIDIVPDQNVTTPPPVVDSNTTATTDPNDVPAPPPTLRELLLACNPTSANNYGVGKACSTSSDCEGKAPFCTGDYVKLNHAVCTNFCANDATCGTDARCVQDPNNTKIFVCAPTSCVPTSMSLPTPTPLKNCLPSRGNNVGIGAPCNSSIDCAFGLNCTNIVTGAPLAFCSAKCSSDRACGNNAVCVVNPLGGSTDRGCVPTSCLP